MFTQPMVYYKNRGQGLAMGKEPPLPLTMNPRVLYRGVGVFALSFAPTIAIQTAVSGLFSETLGPLVGAMVGGGASALAVAPAEAIMIQQQGTGQSILVVIRRIHRTFGWIGFARAIVPTAGREGIFTTAYYAATPMIKQQLHAQGLNENVSQLGAGVIAGMAAAVISQPLDTRKTQLQSDFSQAIPIKALFQKSAFAGLLWRTGMVTSAITVMAWAQKELKKLS